MKNAFWMALVACVVNSPAWGQDECSTFVGRTVSPITIQQAAARLSSLTPKDEFETTAQYEARIATALETAGGPFVVGRGLEDAKYLEYDADRGVLVVKSYALHNTTFNPKSLWQYGGPLHDKVPYSTISSAVAVSFDDTEKTVGSYRGTNAFGVSTTVSKIDRHVWGVFDRDLPPAEFRLFKNGNKDNVLGEIVATPDEARALKQTARVAFTMTPKSPFYAADRASPSDATVSDPYEVTTTTHAVFADVQCGLLTDAGGQVLLGVAVH